MKLRDYYNPQDGQIVLVKFKDVTHKPLYYICTYCKDYNGNACYCEANGEERLIWYPNEIKGWISLEALDLILDD